jgi:hypothetical protein
MDKTIDVSVHRLSDESRRSLDETLAQMREDHEKMLALMRELHAEKLDLIDQFIERTKSRRANGRRRKRSR